MKNTKTTLLATALLSALLMGQTATAGQDPQELAVYGSDTTAAKYSTESNSRVNYSITEADLSNNSDLFTDHER